MSVENERKEKTRADGVCKIETPGMASGADTSRDTELCTSMRVLVLMTASTSTAFIAKCGAFILTTLGTPPASLIAPSRKG